MTNLVSKLISCIYCSYIYFVTWEEITEFQVKMYQNSSPCNMLDERESLKKELDIIMYKNLINILINM